MMRSGLIQIARMHHRTVSEIALQFALDLGMLPLTGTSNAVHIRMNLDLFDFHTESAEMHMNERLQST